MESNLTQVDTDGDEPALLLSECGEEEKEGMILLNEKNLVTELKPNRGEGVDTNVWFDNGASNHMTG